MQRAERRYSAALDSLATVLLEVGLLRRIFSIDEAGDVAYSKNPADKLPPKKPPVAARIEAQLAVQCQNRGAGQ